MDYGFHHNKPTEVRLVKSTKAIIIPAPEPVLYHRMTVAQRASGKVHYIETSKPVVVDACAACLRKGHYAACRACLNRKS